jgi:hypothetical protein
MLFEDIPEDFKIQIREYFNDLSKQTKNEGNYLSINGTLFPKNLKTQHQMLSIYSKEHIDFMIELLYLLHIFHNFSMDNNIIYSLIYGNLLGYYRENNVLVWDDDIDLFISNTDGIKKLLDLWNNGGKEYKIWDRHWIYKNITLNGHELILIKFKNKTNWFKLKLNSKTDKRKLPDFGGIDIIYFINGIDGFGWGPYPILNDYEINDTNYPIIKYGTIETRALIEKPSRIILNKRYGMNWIEKTHPSLHK